MKKINFIAMLLLALLVCSPFVSAAASCTSVTLAGTVNNGNQLGPPATSGPDPCTNASGLTFSNWQGFFGTGFTNFSFSFTANFLGAGLVTMNDNIAPPKDWDLQFLVTGSLSSIVLANTSDAGTSITETVCSVHINLGSSCVGSGGVVLGSGTVTGSNSTTINISGGNGIFWIFKDISGTSSFSQTFTAIPEPVSMSLIGAGLLGLGIFGRRLRRK